MSDEEKKAKARERSKAYYRANRDRLIAAQKERDAKKAPEEKSAYRRQYWAANREKLLAQQRERGKRNYEADPASYRARNKRSRIQSYGLTEAEYGAMLTAQAGLCPLCDKEMDPPVIDHCHDTGAVRGLLCRPCNAALGVLGDTEESIRRVLSYLTRSSFGANSTPSSD